MKIAFVTDKTSSHGGSHKMMIWLLNHLSKENDVTYITLSNDTPFFQIDDKVRFIKLNCNSKNGFLYRNTISIVKAYLSLKNLEKKEKFDVYINFGDHSMYALLLLKLFKKVKLIVSQRVDPYSLKKLSYKLRLKLYKYCDGLVCQTAGALQYFKEKGIDKKNRGVAINNPAIRKATKFWDCDDNENYIVTLGRINFEQKRQDVLIEAFSIVVDRYPNELLYVFGAADEKSEEKLNSIIKKYKLEDNVKYMGVTDNPIDVLLKSKMFVLSSDFEGIPNCLIEAMDVGVPIVTTDFKPDGARLLLNNNVTGIVVPRGNSEELAKGILFYLDNVDLSSKYAKEAQKSLSRFDENKIIMQWNDYINTITNE